MAMTLDESERFLSIETPREYLQQLAVCSEAMRKARGKAGEGGHSDLQDALASFRETMEPRGGA